MPKDNGAAPFITVSADERPTGSRTRSGITQALLDGQTIFTTNPRHRVNAYAVGKRYERKAVTRAGEHEGTAGFFLWLE